MASINNKTIEDDPAIVLINPSETYITISALPDEMVKYELESQGMKCADTIVRRRNQLCELFQKGKYKTKTQPVVMNATQDVAQCKFYLNKWREEFVSSNKSASVKNQYSSRISFLRRRLNFIQPIKPYDHDLLSDLKKKLLEFTLLINLSSENNKLPNTDPPSVAINDPSPSESQGPQSSTRYSSPVTSRSNLHNSLAGDYLDHILGEPILRYPQSSSQSQIVYAPNNSHVMEQSSVTNTGKPKIQIWKWDIKFRGEPHSLSVIEFVRRVRELAKARGATIQDLFNSSCDLFEGSALKWYRAGLASQNFSNWNELEHALLTDFESYEYEDNLLEYIKKRLQKPNERIVSYFACMEDLFLKLSRPISDEFKVKIIRRNLLSEFIKGLGCQPLYTVHELKAYCKFLESDFERIRSRNVNFNYKEPEALSKQVRFSDRCASLERNTHYYESDYERYEGSDYVDTPSKLRVHDRSQSPGRHFSASPIPESNYNQYHSSSRRSNSPDPLSFDRRMAELSVREEPHRPYFSVPPPNYAPNNYYFAASSSDAQFEKPGHEKSYFAPSRNGNSSFKKNYPPSPNSENISGRSQNRTPASPQVLKRPY